jgi:hypothetical protein
MGSSRRFGFTERFFSDNMCDMSESHQQNKDQHTYEMMGGKILSVGWLEEKQIAVLENLKAAANRGADYFTLLEMVRGKNSPMLKDFGGQVTPEACQSIFFQVALDIVERAGVAQGRTLPAQETILDPNVPFLSLSETARLLGKSRAAIHLALTKGKIHGWRVGSAWIVDRASALRYGQKHQKNPSPG